MPPPPQAPVVDNAPALAPSLAPDIAAVLANTPEIEVLAVSSTGTARGLGGNLGKITRLDPNLAPDGSAWTSALAKIAPAFRVKASDIEHLKSSTDANGKVHARFLQRRKGLEVVGAGLTVHADKDGKIYAALGNLRDDDTVPAPGAAKITVTTATQTAATQTGMRAVGTPRLIYLLTSREQELHLAWEVHVVGKEMGSISSELVYVDAVDGQVVDRHSRICDFRYREVYKKAAQLPGDPYPDMDPNTPGPQLPAGYPAVLFLDDGGNTSPFVPNTQPPTKVWDYTHPSVTSVASANWTILSQVYDFYNIFLQRDSYNGGGAHIITFVNGFDDNSVNGAAWMLDEHKIYFGSGDGVNSGPLAKDPDVVAHEFTHGVTQFTSGLGNANEEGALNEGFSDVMAAASEWYNSSNLPNAATWQIGETSYTPSTQGDAVRYLNNPSLGKTTLARADNSVYDVTNADYYPTRYTDVGDNGGTHINSGIVGLAFYLLSQGGQHPTGATTVNVPAVSKGIETATNIFYNGFTQYLFPGAQFADARVATVLAAQDKYGAVAATDTALAWDAVGVPNIGVNTHPINVSIQTKVGTGANIVIAGFVLSGSGGSKQLLLRGLGPALSAYGVQGVLANPQIQLYNITSSLIASNDNWGNRTSSPLIYNATQQVGAFALADNSLDAVLLQTLTPGAYTLQLSGVGGTTGQGMIEVFDTNPSTGPFLTNLSTRCLVIPTPTTPTLTGVIVNGQTNKLLLIRAIGPTLSNWGVSGVLPNPSLNIHSATAVIYSNDDWKNTKLMSEATAKAGAFTLPANSLDAALVVSLPPGGYTVEVNSVTGASGVCLVEVYTVDGLIP